MIHPQSSPGARRGRAVQGDCGSGDLGPPIPTRRFRLACNFWYLAALDRIRGRPVFPLSSTSLWEIDPLAGKSDVSRSVASRSGWRYHAGTAARGRRPLAEENPPGHASEVVPDTRHKHEYQPEVIAGMENVEGVCGRPIYTSDDKVGLSREYLRRFKSKNLPGATAAFLFVSSLSISPNRDDSRQ